MWDQVRRALAKVFPGRSLFTEVVYETPSMSGQSRNSLFQWRVKRRADGALLVSLKIIPDYFAGPEGRLRNYIDFVPSDAQQIKAALEACLAECDRLHAGGTAVHPGAPYLD